jgi:hypothetical protein
LYQPKKSWQWARAASIVANRAGNGLAGGDHPADGVPAVDVEDDVEVVVGPFRGAVQLGDVPGVDLVRPGGDELGLDGGGVGRLRAALPALS